MKSRRVLPVQSRREFLAASALWGGVLFLPSRVLGQGGQTPPSRKLNIAAVGVGGMGASDLGNWGGENVIALCDVDDRRAAGAFQKHPNAARFKDYRVMLDKLGKDLDAVSVSTPDHMHAPIALAAMQLGKHVYVQKPMAQTIALARRMQDAAHRYKVVTQMGIQMHASEGNRRVREWVAAGIIGDVRRVDCWTNRPTWPQGMTALPEQQPVPPELDWDLWQGGQTNYKYNSAFLPGSWRGWYAFGCGALGDMGTHIFDFVSSALDLGVPARITGEVEHVSPVAFPRASVVTYEFAARGARPPVTLTWRDGNRPPEKPAGFPEGEKVGDAMIGAFLHGDKGTIWINADYSPRLLPMEQMRERKDELEKAKTLPRVAGSHYAQFLRACKGEDQTEAHFDYAGPLTEVVLAGAIAQRCPGRPLVYNRKAMKFDGDAEATALIQRSMPAPAGTAA